MMQSVPGIGEAALGVIAREHAAAKAQREANRGTPRDPSVNRAVVDFRTSERHRTGYLSIGPDQGRFLFAAACARKARHIVEFGTSFGISTLYLAAAAQTTDGFVVGSEYHPDKAAKATASLSEAKFSDRATVRVGDGRETLADVDKGIEFLFLDGAKDLYLPILSMLEPKLAPFAVVVADNIDHLEDDDPFLAHIRGGAYATSLPAFGKGAMSFSVRTGEGAA